jgi:hypothetical protein
MITEDSLDTALNNVINLSDSLFIEISNDHKKVQDLLEPGIENGLHKAHQLTFEYTRKAERANALREAVTLIKWHLEEPKKYVEVPKNSVRS